MILFDVFPNFSFTTSEGICNYYLWTWYILVAWRLVEQLKKLGKKPSKESKFHSMIAQSPCPRENKNFANTRKKILKNRLNFSRSAQFHTKTRVSLKYPVNDWPFKPLHKNYTWAYPWINSPKCYRARSYSPPMSWHPKPFTLPYFLHNPWKNASPTLYSISWQSAIVWLD